MITCHTSPQFVTILGFKPDMLAQQCVRLTVSFLMSTSGVAGAEETEVLVLAPPAPAAPLPPTLDLSNTLGAFFVTTSSSCCNFTES